jgi:heterodisulfide reductase subunit C
VEEHAKRALEPWALLSRAFGAPGIRVSLTRMPLRGLIESNEKGRGKLKVAPSPTIEKIGLRDREFSRKTTGEVRNLSRCYQCSMCSDGCPVAYAMDYHPDQIIHLVRLGLKDKVLQSAAIWICASCETCATRCPNDIDIVRLMDVLRSKSLEAGFKGPFTNIPKFHKVFTEQIRKRGRIDEARLLIDYELKTGDFLSLEKIREEGSLGLEMFRKGKLKLPSRKKHSVKAVRKIFRRVFSDV